jgi:hypothetical protein
VAIKSGLLEDVQKMRINAYQDASFWIVLAVILYPKIVVELLKITELEKQNESHSSFTGW